ncbi:hypothetical protein TeGR_g13414 [Tetraparma gracilis]|uniref:Calmodulin n=1 Tax=Tetraparma gracilis TaxID=2962635 RepID=A0ABQ6MX48_9STRA|nr:hypothetical protein TeGR_g13414 [Tetraparma gracilis]
MKFFKTIKAVASGACEAAAAVADTALFAGVPVVSTVLNVASSISGKIEERQEADETLETVHSMLSGIAPVIAQVGAAAKLGDTPPAEASALVGALQAMAATMKEVQKQVDSYTNTWTGLKYVVAKEAEEDLQACLKELDRQLNLVSTAISGQTYVEVLRSQGMLEELKLGVFGTERHLAEIRGEMVTSEQMDAVSRQMTSAQEVLGRGQAETNGKLDDLSRLEKQKCEDEVAVLELQTKLARQRMNSATPTLNKNSSSAITRPRLEGDIERAAQMEEERRAAQQKEEALEAKLAQLEMNLGNPTLNKNSSSAENETADEKWDRLKDDAGAEGNTIPAGPPLVTAIEDVFLDGGDVCNKEVLIAMLDLDKSGDVTKGEFKKFYSRWKKTGLDFAAYLEQETEKKRKEEEEEEAERKAQEEAAEAKRVVDEKRRQAEAAAEKKGDAKMVRELLAAGADVNHTKEGDDGKTALWWAAMQEHLEAAQALIGAGADVDKGDTNEATPLYWAAYRGNLEIVKALVGAKANVNKASNFGTPITAAINKTHTSVIEYLKSVGAR